MPVRVQTQDGSAPLALSAGGAIPTEYRPSGPGDVIVPWLVMTTSPLDVRLPGLRDPDAVLHALDDDQRLVAIAGDAGDAPLALFPREKVVIVPIDLSRPLPGPLQAWESLDAIALGSASAGHLTDVQRESLVAAGITLAVRSQPPPDSRWPWKQRGDYWVLSRPPAGPSGVIEPDAYAPTYEWVRGWPLAFRRKILLTAATFILPALGLLLWRSRRAIVAFVAFCALAWALLWGWYGQQSPVLTLSAGIMVANGQTDQLDVWHWLSPVRASDGRFPAAGLCHPVLPDPQHAARTRLRLVCGSDGTPLNFAFHLEAGQSLAFMIRMVSPVTSRPALAPAADPFRSFARDLYLREDQTIAGQFHAAAPQTEGSMPVIVLAPAPPH